MPNHALQRMPYESINDEDLELYHTLAVPPFVHNR